MTLSLLVWNVTLNLFSWLVRIRYDCNHLQINMFTPFPAWSTKVGELGGWIGMQSPEGGTDVVAFLASSRKSLARYKKLTIGEHLFVLLYNLKDLCSCLWYSRNVGEPGRYYFAAVQLCPLQRVPYRLVKVDHLILFYLINCDNRKIGQFQFGVDWWWGQYVASTSKFN